MTGGYRTAGVDLASSLPMEIDRVLRTADSDQRFPCEESLDRVAEREGSDRSAAARHAAVVVGLVSEVTPAGEMAQVRGGLPAKHRRRPGSSAAETDLLDACGRYSAVRRTNLSALAHRTVRRGTGITGPRPSR
jgi:hypothetical protein